MELNTFQKCLEYIEEKDIGILPKCWYKAQAVYLEKALNKMELDKAYSLSAVWRNITNLGCGYDSTLEQKCWDNCPPILKNERLGVFKNPK